LTVNKAEFAANKAAIIAKILSNIGCSSAVKCGSAAARVTVRTLYTLPAPPAGRRLQSSLSFPSGEIEVVAVVDIGAVTQEEATRAADNFEDIKRYATNLVGETNTLLTSLLGITVSGTSGSVTVDIGYVDFIQLAPPHPSAPPSPPPPPLPPPKALGVGEMSKEGLVKDYTTFFNSNLDGCYAKMAAPRITADIAAALGFSESLVHVTPTETATGSPWDNTGVTACPVATGRRLEARGLSAHSSECTVTRTKSCLCSTGACFMQTRFMIVIRVPLANAAATAAADAAITTLMTATRAAMYSSAALTTLFPSLQLDAEYRSAVQLSGSSDTVVSSPYTTKYYYSSPSPPPPTPLPSPPPPSPSPPSPPPPTPVVVPPVVVLSPSSPPAPAMCACDQLINGASVFNTCVKIQGKQRVCSGLGLTNQGASLCAADHYLCPSSNVPTAHNSPDLLAGSGSCKDQKGKYREKKCAKKLAKGKCSKKKVAKKCRETCDLCNQ
jgi:hypothetical protein